MILAAATSTGSRTGTGTGSVADDVVEGAESMVDAVTTAGPRIGVGLLILIVAWLLGRVVRRILTPRLARARTRSFGQVFGTLAYAGVITLGFVIALPIAFPSVNALTILSGLGLVGVAAGFAFQDILSNLLSGLLLIVRQPFRSGDQIEVNGIAGTVDVITIRETRVVGFDGRLVYIPNQDVYMNAIEVQTGRDEVRTSLVVGVDYDADLGRARAVALEALGQVDGVHGDPAPQAYYTEFGASSINLDLRYWTDPQQAAIRAVQDRVVERIKAAFDAAGIDIPYDIVTLDAGDGFREALGARRDGT